MRRKKQGESHENQDRWLLTYADMITLLMAFFIMMYSMSVLNLSKFHEAAISIRSGFGGIIRAQGKSVLGMSSSYTARPSPIQPGDISSSTWGLVKPLVTYIEGDKDLKKGTRITMDERGIVVSMLSDNLLFEPGSAKIRRKAYPLLDRVAEMASKTNNCIRVEGHTCDLPPRSGKYPTNWELSTARSTNVLRFFVEAKGMDARRFSAAGYAGQHPIAPNKGEANRRRNRRVDVVIVAEQVPVVAPGEIRRRTN